MSSLNNGYGCSWSSRSRLLILLLPFLLAACGTTPPQPAAIVLPITRPSAPSQPYDAFRGDLLDAIVATVLADRDQCMAKAGHPELQKNTAARPVTGSFNDLRVNLGSFGATSADEARQRGFGRVLPAAPPAVRNSSRSFADAIARCTQEANAHRGPNAGEVQSRYYDLGNQLRMALRPVYADTMPDRFAVPILACLQREGFRSKSADVRTFGVQFAKQATPYVPTSQESALAVAWYECTTAAGWPRFQLNRALALEVTAVRRFKPQLDELTPAIEALVPHASYPQVSSER
ncbi:hypothetical protein E1263_22430 [Kribbella antibiotica]|uniref:Uncharacterized protein n=1 Tax=Kribbella antibiotica TaxID=190195 RepID=A0A4R4ZGQ5_9ACTN|nr:hypothetical protein [Kribbella antibiotica]TDD57723.1 hypothetical protein E1263_22430 [Kribbella antibiotica]